MLLETVTRLWSSDGQMNTIFPKDIPSFGVLMIMAIDMIHIIIKLHGETSVKGSICNCCAYFAVIIFGLLSP